MTMRTKSKNGDYDYEWIKLKKTTSLRKLKKQIKRVCALSVEPLDLKRNMSIFKTLKSWVRCKKTHPEYRKRKANMKQCLHNYRKILVEYADTIHNV